MGHAFRLEIPARLKIAIQQVLDEPQQSVATVNYSQDYTLYAADSAQTEQWTEEKTAAYNAYYYGSEAASQSGSQQYADVIESYASTELNSSDVPVVEAHEVVAEEAITYEEPDELTAASWSCRQCTFLNPMSESFCEMCMDHISLSPDALPVPQSELIPLSNAIEQPTSSESNEASIEERACDAVKQEAVGMVSIIPCPEYAPSAPDFEDDIDATISTATASFEEAETPKKNQPPAPHLSSIDFLSLAFQSKSSMKPQETRAATTIEFV